MSWSSFLPIETILMIYREKSLIYSIFFLDVVAKGWRVAYWLDAQVGEIFGDSTKN